jgi:hypothetical protein
MREPFSAGQGYIHFGVRAEDRMLLIAQAVFTRHPGIHMAVKGKDQPDLIGCKVPRR